ncbi:MAG TPA: hypothetical protein DCY48_01345 [Candidatus Magasanikbacteria bacterium]|nr:MAG: hypothetical protein A3I74_03810 [Candidatus Magasanikbacteria bacterium RIFCSPLOWO2_02_FULL_47_16]OGH79293.1 MAG: hypothetical protein A3C10_04350 [Candidatus Magasanikbacteria bacterium RIFCSPHIGHO2_02_FULL_48_18]OGH82221.1 MAG: hypothetical protein A3G08_00980 [Candidatus Magasanikbacteria bacterium RIFCSPLOWO2_12_FULL_47_9b]HAZ28403.1 hypothetical protein [Candidatus Magasanikbacteria bacterium]
MANEHIIQFWKKSADKNHAAAKSLFRLGHYDMCLFCCHLAIEKYLKAYYIAQTGKLPPYIHDLNRIAESLSLPLTDEHITDLDTMTKFNVQGRYDDVKLRFYKTATKPYTKHYLEKTNQFILWLKKESQKKQKKK